MALGERLKQARLEKGLSQRQLCGDEITRNMLSQIENGSAKPSMATLTYLAARLEMPVSYFLEETVVASPNRERLDRARQAYRAGDYRAVCETLSTWEPGEDASERWLLETLALIGQAYDALEDGKPVFARKLLEKAGEAAKNTPYDTQALQRERVLLEYQADPESATALEALLPVDHRELYLRAEAALQKEAYHRAAVLLDSSQREESSWYLLRARAAQGQQDYEKAIACLKAAEPMAPYVCAQGLEQCYLALEDYKMAYMYACKQRNL